jgi:hypothetical protein
VFQHARRLFEMARDVLSAPTEQVEPTRVVQPAGETPHGRVSQWLAEGDYLAVAKVLEHDPGSIAHQARMFDVLLAVVRGMGPDLTASQLTAVQRELSHDGLLVSPAEEITLRLAVAESDVVRRLRADATVPKAFTDLVNAAREPAAGPTVLAMNRLVQVLSAPALREVIAYVRMHHSGAWSVVERRMLWLREFGPAAQIEETKAARIFVAYVDSKPPTAWPLVVLCALIGFGSFLAANVLLIQIVGESMAQTEDMEQLAFALGGIGFCLAAAFAYTVHQERKKAARGHRTTRILAVARRFGLFPSEAVETIVNGMKPQTAAVQFYTMVDSLIEIEADPNALFACWSDTLAARFEAPSSESSA